MTESFICTCGCNEELEGEIYREFIDTWKRPPICKHQRATTGFQSSVWRRRKADQPVLDMSDEHCRPIAGYRGYYVHDTGKITRGREHVMKTRQLPGKAPLVTAAVRDDGTSSMVCVAREVAKAFCPDFRPEMHVGYRDNDPFNCSVSNLIFNTWSQHCRTFKKSESNRLQTNEGQGADA